MKAQLATLLIALACPVFGVNLDKTALESLEEQGAQQIEETSYVKKVAERMATAGFQLEGKRTFVLEASTDDVGIRYRVMQMWQFIKPTITPVWPSYPQRRTVYWETLVRLGFDRLAKPSEEKHVRPVSFNSRSVNISEKSYGEISRTLESKKISLGLKGQILRVILENEENIAKILAHPHDGKGKSAWELTQWILNRGEGEYLYDIINGYFAL